MKSQEEFVVPRIHVLCAQQHSFNMLLLFLLLLPFSAGKVILHRHHISYIPGFCFPCWYVCHTDTFSLLDPPSSLKQNQSLTLSFTETLSTVERWELGILLLLFIFILTKFSHFYKSQTALETLLVWVWLYITINILDIFNDFQLLGQLYPLQY